MTKVNFTQWDFFKELLKIDPSLTSEIIAKSFDKYKPLFQQDISVYGAYIKETITPSLKADCERAESELGVQFCLVKARKDFRDVFKIEDLAIENPDGDIIYGDFLEALDRNLLKLKNDILEKHTFDISELDENDKD